MSEYEKWPGPTRDCGLAPRRRKPYSLTNPPLPAPRGEIFRPGFESWALGEECDLARTEAGAYIDNETQTGWDAWVAAKLEGDAP